MFRLSVEDRSLTLVSTLPLTAVPWCIEFDWSNRLWVCLHDIDEPLQCYECQSEKVTSLNLSDFVFMPGALQAICMYRLWVK